MSAPTIDTFQLNPHFACLLFVIAHLYLVGYNKTRPANADFGVEDVPQVGVLVFWQLLVASHCAALLAVKTV